MYIYEIRALYTRLFASFLALHYKHIFTWLWQVHFNFYKDEDPTDLTLLFIEVSVVACIPQC